MLLSALSRQLSAKADEPLLAAFLGRPRCSTSFSADASVEKSEKLYALFGRFFIAFGMSELRVFWGKGKLDMEGAESDAAGSKRA